MKMESNQMKKVSLYNNVGQTHVFVVCHTGSKLPNEYANGSEHAFKMWLILRKHAQKRYTHTFAAGYMYKN